jgi:long-subunit fatty acid transport protein
VAAVATTSRVPCLWLAAGVVLCAPGMARATVPDTYGNGARNMGMGGGGVAIADDGAAARLNPAGLNRIDRPTVALGFTYAAPRFDAMPSLWWDTNQDGSLDTRDDPLDYALDVEDAVGLSLHIGRNVGGKFGLGLTAYVPVNRLLSFSTFEPDLPNYFLYGHRQQRFALAAGVGGEVLPGLAIGASVDMLAAARFGMVATLDAAAVAEAGGDDVSALVGDIEFDVHDVRLDVVPDFAPIFGAQWHLGPLFAPLDGLWLGASYRGSAGLLISADISVQANVGVEDVGELEPFLFAAVLDAGLLMYDHYVPAQAALGAAYRIEDTLDLYVDVRWTAWSPMLLNVARIDTVDISSPLVDLGDAVTDGNEFEVLLRNVWSVRTGLELDLPTWEVGGAFRYVRLRARGGFGLEPSPLVDQRDSALLDADRTMYTLGAGVEHWDPLHLVNGPVRYDLSFQYHALAPGQLARSSSSPRPGFPVDASGIPVGGHIVVFGFEWGFDY